MKTNKLDQEEVKEIRKLYKEGVSRKTLADQFGVTSVAIFYHTKGLTQSKTHNHTNQNIPRENLGYTGEGKKTIRDHILWMCNREYKKDSNTSIIEFFGLGELFYFLLENTKARIKSIDCDDNIGKKLKNIPFTEYATFQKICQQYEKYKIIFLDYCGDLTRGVEKDIAESVKIMMDSGILCLTLCMRTGKYAKDTSRETMESNYIDTVIRILAEHNITAKLSFVVKYAGERYDPITKTINKKYPMKFYEFTYKKVKDLQQSIEDMPEDEVRAQLKEYLTRPQFITVEKLQEKDELEKSVLSKIYKREEERETKE